MKSIENNIFRDIDVRRIFSFKNILFTCAVLFSAITIFLFADRNPVFLMIMIGILFSSWIAYLYPSLTITLLILLGQVLQYELSGFLVDFNIFQIGSLNLRLSDPLLVAIFFSVIIQIIKTDAGTKRLFFHKSIFLIMLLIYIFAEIFRNVDTYGSYAIGEFRTYYQGLVIVPYMALSFKTDLHREKAVKLITFLALSQIIIALIKGGFLQGFSLNAYDKWLSSFGSLSLLYGLFALYILIQSRLIKLPNSIINLIYLSGIFILVIASVRSVWFAGTIGLIFLIISGQISFKNQAFIIILGIVLLIIVVNVFAFKGYDFIDFFVGRLSAFTDFETDATASWRYYFWFSTIQEISKQVWFGYGLGQNFDIYIVEYGTRITTSPHNFYLTLLYQLGLIGLVLFLLFLGKLWRGLKVIYTDSINTSTISRITKIVIVAVLFYWLAYSTEKEFFTWLFLGLGFSSSINVPARVKHA